MLVQFFGKFLAGLFFFPAVLVLAKIHQIRFWSHHVSEKAIKNQGLLAARREMFDVFFGPPNFTNNRATVETNIEPSKNWKSEEEKKHQGGFLLLLVYLEL